LNEETESLEVPAFVALLPVLLLYQQQQVLLAAAAGCRTTRNFALFIGRALNFVLLQRTSLPEARC
jgi:hypothetical protein